MGELGKVKSHSHSCRTGAAHGCWQGFLKRALGGKSCLRFSFPTVEMEITDILNDLLLSLLYKLGPSLRSPRLGIWDEAGGRVVQKDVLTSPTDIAVYCSV